MNNSEKNILSPCISICKNDPETGFCYGCARTDKEKKIWKRPDTSNDWKKENLDSIVFRMGESQRKTFKDSYYAKTLKKKPQN